MVYPKIKTESLFTFSLVSHWISSTVWLPTFSKKNYNNILCSIEKEKKTHTGLSQHEGNEDLIFKIS